MGSCRGRQEGNWVEGHQRGTQDGREVDVGFSGNRGEEEIEPRDPGGVRVSARIQEAASEQSQGSPHWGPPLRRLRAQAERGQAAAPRNVHQISPSTSARASLTFPDPVRTCPGRLPRRRRSRPAGSAESPGSCQNFSH